MSTKAHILLLVVTLATMAVILRMVARQRLRAKYALLWLSVGAVLVVYATVPVILDKTADWLGIAYQPALFMLLALAFLFLLAVHFSWELSRLEDRVRTLAEEIALLRHDLRHPERSEPSPTGERTRGQDRWE